ncbi:hypothetical protein EYB26_009280 [Talaromyces marneffei]|uniref:BTB domain-containing protein n=1 Tax=Talaromyces marneffei PM1 TaxID=1077442 RepID=A0A093VK31_TALMA|nr:uncharacterized protein EYB26_009280 [Talaromyces marneffei]QGA21569.1 hypothetical protein EYB26_009280 [Talaromyces marneffei]
MDQPTHIIDEDGEVTIILRNANAPFAYTSMDDNIQLEKLPETLHEIGEYVPKRTEQVNKPCDHSTKMVTSKKDKKPKRLTKPTNLEPIDEHGDGESAGQETGDEDPMEPDFRIQVSAKHLTVASPVFKSILTGPWKESATYLQKGTVEILAEGWDIEAFLILLRVIHCQFNQVPRKLTLDMLAKVAIIVDYYQCKEAVRFFSDTWIDSLEEKIPRGYSRDLILWLWIAWFFQLEDQFGMATLRAITYSNGGIMNLGLPIPERVIHSINAGREESINDVISLLNDTHAALSSGTRGCSFECSSIMCGALAMQMTSNYLLSPKPLPPFPGINYHQLVRTVQSFKSPEWYGTPSSSHSSSVHVGDIHECNDSAFKRLFGELCDTAKCLGLTRFIAK